MLTVARKRILLVFGVVLAVASMSINADQLQPKKAETEMVHRVATEFLKKGSGGDTGQWIGNIFKPSDHRRKKKSLLSGRFPPRRGGEITRPRSHARIPS